MRKNEFEIGDLNDLDLDSHGGGVSSRDYHFTHTSASSQKNESKNLKGNKAKVDISCVCRHFVR
jgi:hypothetical protein